jgi:hypothetical protein
MTKEGFLNNNKASDRFIRYSTNQHMDALNQILKEGLLQNVTEIGFGRVPAQAFGRAPQLIFTRYSNL